MGPWTLASASAGFAAMAVLGWMPGPPRRVTGASADALVAEPPRPPWACAARPPGWRGVLLGRLDAPPFGRRLLVATAGSAMAALLSVLIGGLIQGWLVGVLVAVGSVTGTIGLGLLEPAATRRRRRRLIMDTPQALDLLAACLAAGLPSRTATAAVVDVFDGPLAEDLGAVARAVDIGLSDATAWRSLRGHPQLGEAAVDLARAVESGTRLVETLGYYAREARQRRAAAVESAAKAVGVRCVLPMMVCFIPSFILLGVVPAIVSAFLAAVPRMF